MLVLDCKFTNSEVSQLETLNLLVYRILFLHLYLKILEQSIRLGTPTLERISKSTGMCRNRVKFRRLTYSIQNNGTIVSLNLSNFELNPLSFRTIILLCSLAWPSIGIPVFYNKEE